MNRLIKERAEKLKNYFHFENIDNVNYLDNCNTVVSFSTENICNYIDHTLLSFNATKDEIKNLCEEADKYSFKAICINPVWVDFAKKYKDKISGNYLIATVVDFPFGASSKSAKVAETLQALSDGADEIDMVMGVGMLKSGMIEEVYESIKTLSETGCFLKVILETSALTLTEKIDAALISIFAGADMLKTSTGYNGKASVEDVKLLRAVAGSKTGVKAAGGIKTLEQLFSMLNSGADRIGCSNSVKIIEEWSQDVF